MDIHLNSIYKSFLTKTVLNDLSYSFVLGENYRVTGDNGAGKTTLFRVIVGLLDMDEGTILGNTNIGWVSSSEVGLFGRLTGRENIDVLAKLIPSKELIELDEMIAIWSRIKSFEAALDTPFFKCSSGMKQVIKIFCSVLHSPKILIMDEPFKSLDYETRRQISKILSEIQFIKTIIFSDHFYHENLIEGSTSLRLTEGKLIDFN
jgi:ABC-type multidrug transport system ATPase subunit